MKHVVVTTGLHDADIRPPSLLSEFIRLSMEDAASWFSDESKRAAVDCPACACPDAVPAFSKQGFSYSRCANCSSVYVSPRPSAEQLLDYYAKSNASRYRVEHFARKTAEARRAHLLRNMANWMGRLVDEKGNPDARSFADVGTVSPSLFDEIQGLNLFDTLVALDPLPGLEAELKERDVRLAGNNEGGWGAVTLLEQVEHLFSPREILEQLHARLADGGLLFLTTRTSSGFDLQVLGGKAPYIFVPEHLNLLSVEGLSRLLHDAGFEVIELSTPGQLDLELVSQAVEQDPAIELSPFIDYMIHQRGDLARDDFQTFLQKHRLSSHVRVAARKVTN